MYIKDSMQNFRQKENASDQVQGISKFLNTGEDMCETLMGVEPIYAVLQTAT